MNNSFQQTQLQFTRYLRDPVGQPPAALPATRMQVYVELIYNNIENFLASAFPVLRSIIPDEKWHSLIRDFIRDHSSQTPYFLEISQEFLSYLLRNPHPLANDFPFLTALAHYEWIELVLDIADEELPEETMLPADLEAAIIQISPVSAILAYPWPVHKISSEFLPTESTETHLLVYRNRQDEVKFMELSLTSSRFLQLCRDKPQTLEEHRQQLIHEGMDKEQLQQQLPLLIHQLYSKDLVFFY